MNLPGVLEYLRIWAIRSNDEILQSIVTVQSRSRVQLFVTPWTAAHHASLSFTISQTLLKLMSTESVMPSNHVILCRPLLLLPSIFPSIRAFSNESVLHIRWPKYWSFSFKISPFNEYSGYLELTGSPCSPRDSQESSTTPQFKSINSSAHSLLHSPTLTSIHDHMKNHSLDWTDLSQQSNVSAFEYAYHQANANQNHNEKSPHTCQNDYHQKEHK